MLGEERAKGEVEGARKEGPSAAPTQPKVPWAHSAGEAAQCPGTRLPRFNTGLTIYRLGNLDLSVLQSPHWSNKKVGSSLDCGD